jgi:DNA-binding PadR family transcriptional regulator
MTSFRIVTGIALLLSFPLMQSCKIFRSPKIKAECAFTGVSAFQRGDSLQPQAEVYLMIHGIGPQDDDYARKMIRRLSEYNFGKGQVRYELARLESDAFVQKGRELKKAYFEMTAAEQNSVELMRIVARKKDDSKSGKLTSGVEQAVFYVVNWSKAAELERRKLQTEEFDAFAPNYIGINKWLKKTIMIQRVSDAFSGGSPTLLEPIYRVFLQAIQGEEYAANQRLNLISGSFGSQIFLYCLYRLKHEQAQNPPQSKRGMGKNIFAEKFQLNLFMLTNQVNLMDENIPNWIDYMGMEGNERLPIGHVQVVAFRNPNDLLSYYVPPEIVKSFFASNVDLQVINGYYFNWPVGNDVISSHTRVYRKKKLARAIWMGSDSKRVKNKNVGRCP